MLCIAFILTNLFALANPSSVNYCGSRMCGNTNDHTFCQFREGPSPHCMGYMDAHLTMKEKARVMARLNRRRNEAAAGHLREMPSAGNMLKLRWVEELALEAQRWADQCRPPSVPEEHDACRDLYSIPVGQCVASVVGEAPGLRVESMIDMWYMQSILYKGNVTFYIPPVQNGSFYGDFGQIMWSRSYMVGCARSRFMAPWHGRLRSVERLVCNLAPLGPVPGRPLWMPAEPVTICPPRAVPDGGFDSLCNFQVSDKNVEDISFMETLMTLEEHILLNTVLEIENNQSLNYIGSIDEIYLTQLAIATMWNTVTTQAYHNSVQRRDVLETMELEEANRVTNNFRTVIGLNTSMKLDNTTDAAKAPKKKLTIVGRPKSYNIEELTGFEKHENHGTPNQDLPKKEKDFYSEYEFFETEENTTENVEPTVPANTTAVVTEFRIINENINDIIKEVVRYENSSTSHRTSLDIITWGDTTENTIDILNITEAVENASLPLVDKTVDDYLSDPETVRQLQDALDRMEDTLEKQQMNERQGKVRRDIRNLPPQEERKLPYNKNENPMNYDEIERNRSIARGPMMNMVLRYMPYLKEYESGLLGTSSNGVDRLSPSVVLVILLCLYLIV